MNKYLAIINVSTLVVTLLSVVVTFIAFRFGISYDIDITLFSVAVIFPLVFTIREAFKRRDSALKFLSTFKASMSSVHYCFAQCRKLSSEQQATVVANLEGISTAFMDALHAQSSDSATVGAGRKADAKVNELFLFVQHNDDEISSGLALKIIRFLQDVNESIENTISLKLHGTPVSLRAYCLVFVYVFPFVFAPTIVYYLPQEPLVITYGLAALHGFILISLYNVQMQMENPFDQVGLDDIQLREYAFTPIELHLLKPPKPPKPAKPKLSEPSA